MSTRAKSVVPAWLTWRRRVLGTAAMSAIVASIYLYVGYHRWLGSGRLAFGSVADLAPEISLIPAVVVAYSAASFRRTRTDLVVSITPLRRRHEAVAVAALGAAATIGLCVVAFGAMVASALSGGGWQFAGVGRLLPASAACFAMAALGARVGRHLPWPPMALLLAPAGWAAYAMSLQIGVLDPLQLYRGLWDPAQSLPTLFVALQTVAYFAAGIALLCRRSDYAFPTRVVPVFVAAICVGVLLPTGANWTQERPAATQCQIAGVVRLCLPIGQSVVRTRLLPILHQAITSTSMVDPSLANPHRTAYAANGASVPDSNHRIHVVRFTGTAGSGFAMDPVPNDTLVDLIPTMINPRSCLTRSHPQQMTRSYVRRRLGRSGSGNSGSSS